jgi:1-aminocyclopropane-1-carboxylate deaminase
VIQYTPIIQKLSPDLFSEKEIGISILRLDLIHPQISGNKWFKLKYNLEEAKKQGLDTVLTFGGAFSNHIHATAIACKQFGFKSIGIIRGEKEAETNFTLFEAKRNGMQLCFVSRDDYKHKTDQTFIDTLKKQFGNFYLIPEGGNNLLGEKGCEEILPKENDHDYIFCACGTATTFTGISKQIKQHQKLIGISVLKGEGKMTEEHPEILTGYHFGGYAKHTDQLLEFKKQFELQNNIPLDYVYTAKLFYAVHDLISKDRIQKNSKVLIIHSGGLQGNTGYEERYRLMPNRKVNDIQG